MSTMLKIAPKSRTEKELTNHIWITFQNVLSEKNFTRYAYNINIRYVYIFRVKFFLKRTFWNLILNNSGN